MKLRAAILSGCLALIVLAAPWPALGQQSGKGYRIGFLAVGPAPAEKTPNNCPSQGAPAWRARVEVLREYGYVEGRNVAFECRWTEGRDDRAPALAAELVSLKVDLILAVGTPQVRAAKQATSTIPIVMSDVIDPVGQGLVTSLSHPGGNVTGATDTVGTEIVGKHLQILKEAVPKASRIAVLSYANPTPDTSFQREVQVTAQALRVTLQPYGVRDPKELPTAFTAMSKARTDALLVLPHPMLYMDVERLIDLAARGRLPAIYSSRAAVDAGGLLAYAVNDPDRFGRFGYYVDRILKGAKPADLPVEQPTKFELLINLKTAKALRLTIPPSLLNRADEVIE